LKGKQKPTPTIAILPINEDKMHTIDPLATVVLGDIVILQVNAIDSMPMKSQVEKGNDWKKMVALFGDENVDVSTIGYATNLMGIPTQYIVTKTIHVNPNKRVNLQKIVLPLAYKIITDEIVCKTKLQKV